MKHAKIREIIFPSLPSSALEMQGADVAELAVFPVDPPRCFFVSFFPDIRDQTSMEETEGDS